MGDRAVLTVWLSGVRNPTHLVYAASWIRTQRAARIRLIDAGGFIARGLVTKTDIDRWLGTIASTDVVAGSEVDATHGDAAYVAIGVPGIKPWLALRRRRGLRRLPVIVVDEGLGSYGTVATQRAALLRQGGREPRVSATALARSAARGLTTTRWPLYRRRRGVWQVNDACAAEFRRVSPDPRASDAVVYLSQPWPALGVIGAQEYAAYLCDLATAVEAQGTALWVKPHPMESVADFAGLSVLDSSAPAELDGFVIGARAVVGTQSTALVNLAAIHRRPAHRLWLPRLAALHNDLAPRQSSLLNAFLPSPKPIHRLTIEE